MKTQNHTSFSEFHLLGFSEDPELQPVLFGLFLSMFLVTVLGNLLIILAVISDSHLHTPMYFFLSNLSFSDIGFISTMVPKMIVDILTENRVISYEGCLTQMTFYVLFGYMDCMLLTVMGYDRFVAICYPLHYHTIMNPCSTASLLLVSFLDWWLPADTSQKPTCTPDAQAQKPQPETFLDKSNLETQGPAKRSPGKQLLRTTVAWVHRYQPRPNPDTRDSGALTSAKVHPDNSYAPIGRAKITLIMMQ
ncbi:Olfactory receptor 7E24 [Fukomys damarensis]|uniref:Olfactory receptor 7E24 n=1 Tax=Fukomys damarensis TaxID=885580 RepID=A0A091DJN1_FUKDA|nr:Olfactory receptor 7E24 [Fukomys damarensis]